MELLVGDDDDDAAPLAIQIEDQEEELVQQQQQKQRRSVEDPISSSDTENRPGDWPGSPVGVTVVTGYLGAGKSTLVNYILNAQHGKKIAVILNEFGEEIGVERAMINEGEGGAVVEEWVELANGCVCCTVKHSLVQALEQLVQRKDRLDHILLETTGLADPAPLVSILWLDDQLESAVRLDSIITVVDAKNLRLQLEEHKTSSSFPEALLQIAFADVIILNKTDLISHEDSRPGISDPLEVLEKEIIHINSLASIIRSIRCQVDLSKILDRRAYGVNNMAYLEELLEDRKSMENRLHHDSTVRTICICEDQPVDLNKVNLWLVDLLWEKKYNTDIYRCKGVLNVHGSHQLHILQAVREIYEIVPAREWRQNEKNMSKIVFIGHNLDTNFLSEMLRACTVSA